MIELIINLIIVFVVIASVLKRIREIGEKGGELDKPPPAAEPQEPDLRENRRPYPRQRLDEEQSIPPQQQADHGETVYEMPGMETGGEEEALRERFRGEGAWEKEVETSSTEDMISELEARAEKILATVPAAGRSTVSRDSGGDERRTSALGLSFGSDDIVRGLVMGEILGKPVSLRNAEHPHLL